jgi:TRAP transporter 4TM/12TM fusion protein
MDTVAVHVFGDAGMIGLPSVIIGDILIGFLLFAGMLLATGAGEFFLKIAQAFLGGFRGGPAKVAVVSSGFFGSLTGSSLSNVVATGSVTIPAMKRMGYSPELAGAIEACASTGGVFMPPIMGAVAFVMAAFLNIEYRTIIIAAAVPSVLYYLGLLMQVDSYAAKNGLKGFSREELPAIKQTLKEGWIYLTVFFFLLWGLLYMRWEMYTPYYATALMFFLSFFRKKTMMTFTKIIEVLIRVGTIITQSMAIILPIGFIVAGLTIPGTSNSFSAGLIQLAGGNLYLVILIGIAVCYILGMAGMLVSAYIFLAVTLAPALVELGGLNVLAVHLFIIYYAMLSCLTPPVAVVAFLGASIAGASPMKTSLISMRLGFVKYFIPIFFLFNPTLIFQGKVLDGFYHFAASIVGVVIIAGGLDGYLIGIGRLGMISRFFFIASGLLIAFPQWNTTLVGSVFTLVIIMTNIIRRKWVHSVVG